MRVSTIAAAGLLVLAALPAAAQERYSARGTEPFWSLTIDARTMRFEAAGRAPVTVATPKVIHGFAGEMWQGRRIDVNTVHGGCSDGMSDRRYSDTVTVRVDGRSYRGCGGDMVEAARPSSVVDGSWRIEALDGRRVSALTSPDVTFRDGRMQGDTSCNRFSGSFSFTRGRLTAGPLATTRKFCAERVQSVQETAILRMFRERLSVSSNRGGKLVLTAPGGRTMTLAPAGRR
jgi:heat shock protein HslJ